MSLSSKEYFIRETGKSMRNGIMSFASVSTVAVSLLVLGMFLLMYLNTDNLAKYLESQVEMTVYLEDTATGEEVADIREKLKKMEGVVKVTEVTKAMAMDRFKNRLGDQATLLKALGKDNPFPFSFEVQVDKPERIKALVSQVEHWPKVETAKFGQEVVEHLFALTRVLRLGGAVLIVFLCFATLFIIINTIRLTVFARRREVVIMKYVGATDWFIRWPRHRLVHPLAFHAGRHDAGTGGRHHSLRHCGPDLCQPQRQAAHDLCVFPHLAVLADPVVRRPFHPGLRHADRRPGQLPFPEEILAGLGGAVL